MKPIAQTFYINEPAGGAPGVYLTSVDLFFRKKHPFLGVTVYINTTDNGTPTPNSLAFSKTSVSSDQVNISQNASAATKFTFNSPIYLQTDSSYAILIVPDGGNPEYEIFTAKINENDLTIPNTPIKTNNDIGTLFLSSNDIQFTSVIDEDIKFNLYIADFTKGGAIPNPTGKAVFISNQEKFYLNDLRGGNFYSPETLFVSNDAFGFTIAKFGYSGNTIAFNNGESIYQNDGYSNTAYGKIYSINTVNHTFKVANTVGIWDDGIQIKGVTSGANAVISDIYQSVSTTLSSNTITVPFTDPFYIGQWIYVGTESLSQTYVHVIKDIKSNGTDLQLGRDLAFTEPNAKIGQINGDGEFYGEWYGPTKDEDIRDPDNIRLLSRWNDTATYNHYLPFNNLIIGMTSHCTAKIKSLRNYAWNSVVPQFTLTTPPSTGMNFVMRGAENASGFGSIGADIEAEEYIVTPNIANEFYDKERMILSRSNEVANKNGEFTFYIASYMSTANGLVSPVIDSIRTFATTTHNYTYRSDEIEGVTLSIENNNSDLENYALFGSSRNLILNDNIVQYDSDANAGDPAYIIATGSILDVSENKITVGNVVGTFSKSDTASGVIRYGSIQTTPTTPFLTINVSVIGVTSFNETLNVNQYYSSRYISKAIVLDEGQDAEDLICYITAYRPATTDFQVYAKPLHREDSDSFNSKLWTRLEEKSSAALLSSRVNLDDFVELSYGFPVSAEIIPQDANSTLDSVTIKMDTTSGFAINDYIYIADLDDTNNFNVRKVVSVDDNTTLTLNANVSFTSVNSAVGVIPNLNDVTSGFVYSENDHIVRYVSNNDVIFDGYKTFAIKIVPVSETSYIIPRAKDMRCIALQI